MVGGPAPSSLLLCPVAMKLIMTWYTCMLYPKEKNPACFGTHLVMPKCLGITSALTPHLHAATIIIMQLRRMLMMTFTYKYKIWSQLCEWALPAECIRAYWVRSMGVATIADMNAVLVTLVGHAMPLNSKHTEASFLLNSKSRWISCAAGKPLQVLLTERTPTSKA